MMNSPARSSKFPIIQNRYFLLADALLMPLAVGISFCLRLDAAGLQHYAHTILVFALLAAILKPPVFYLFGLYRRCWRYASASELVTVALAAFAATAVVSLLMFTGVPFLAHVPSPPRSIPILDFLVSLVMVGGTRFSVRLAAQLATTRTRRSNHRNGGRPQERRVLIMGAGDAGAMVVREMQANPGLGLIPAGLLDDDRTKVGLTIHGVPVYGTREDIPGIVKRESIDEVIIAMPTAPGRSIRDVVAACKEHNVACRTVPGIYELISGQVSVRQLRDVRIEDLLRREPIQIEGKDAERYLSGAVVLVTGAGGSIGSELCRQIAHYHPQRLLLLGHGENSIFHIVLELAEKFPHLAIQSFIADVRDRDRLASVFATYRPSVVYHAAAHKHVPMMEANVAEAVMNNVFGTRNLLRVAEENGTTHFAFISSDKAVNPSNIMGATKRVAELLVQDVARRTGRPYVAVRFGNVLGSRGSVVPLFQRQIAIGGPVTVTHPDMQRYFMTIPEAVQLTIQAAALGKGGEVFVLDMGEPMRVVDLATELIHLCGLEPGRDIDVVFTGLRPGEKLHEVLFAEGEERRPTRHEKVLVAHKDGNWDSQALSSHLQHLERVTREGDPARIRAKIQVIVPEFRPLEGTPLDPATGLTIRDPSGLPHQVLPPHLMTLSNDLPEGAGIDQTGLP